MKKQNVIDLEEIFLSIKKLEKNEQKKELEQFTDELSSFIKEYAKKEKMPISKIKDEVIKGFIDRMNQRFNKKYGKNNKRKNNIRKIFLTEITKMLNKKI